MLRCVLIVAGLMVLGLPARADWTAAADNTGNVVNAHTTATDGKINLSLTCNRNMVPGVYASLYDYTGNALERLPDVERPVSLRVAQPDGPKDFPSQAHYVLSDGAWVVGKPNLPPAFADALRRGTLLTLSNARGVKVADFDLRGVDKAVDLMRQVCQPSNAAAANTATYRAKAMAFLKQDDASSGSDRKIFLDLVDLNGDGIPEALARVESRFDCGSRGCAAYVLDLTGPTARSMGDFIAQNLKVLPSKTGQWTDVSLNGHKMVFRSGKYEAAR